MEKVEFLILRNLLHNEEYLRKVVPFLKSEYFEDEKQKIVYQEIASFVEEYNELTTKEVLCIEIEKRKDIKNKYAPSLNLLEDFRIKKYDTSGNQRFDEHVDITDFDSSIRAISFLFYLNDNDGNTLFPLHNLNIQPVSGRVIVFPPTWEYPHQGLAPKINSKYIMSTYIHYGKNWNYYSS